MQVVVTKHHGLGNEFLVLDVAQLAAEPNLDSTKIDWSNMAQQWCDRQDGVGAD